MVDVSLTPDTTDGRWPSCRVCDGRKQTCHGYPWLSASFTGGQKWTPDLVTRDTGVGDCVFSSQSSSSSSPSPSFIPYAVSSSSRPSSSTPPPAPSAMLVPAGWLNPAPATPPAQDPLSVYVPFFLSGFRMSVDPVRKEFLNVFPIVLEQFPRAADEARDRSANPLVMAAATLAEGHFGKAQRLSGVVRSNYGTYGRALSCVAAKLAEFQQLLVLKRTAVYEWQMLTMATCLLMTWELNMNQNGSSWRNHTKGLSFLIASRPAEAGPIPPHEMEFLIRCKTIILFAIISQSEPVDGSYNSMLTDSEICLLRPDPYEAQDPVPADLPVYSRILGPPDRVNHVMGTLQAVASLRSQYQVLWDERARNTFSDSHFDERLARIHLRASTILRQVEANTAHWQARDLQEWDRATWRSWPIDDSDPIRQWATDESDPHGLLATAFDFQAMETTFIIGASRLSAIVLHLIHRDILLNRPPGYAIAVAEVAAQQAKGGVAVQDTHQPQPPAQAFRMVAVDDAAAARSLAAHRVALVRHARAVVKEIPWMSQRHVCSTTLLVLSSHFYAARYAMEVECEMIRKEGASEGGKYCGGAYTERLSSCEAMHQLITAYIDWTSRSKIVMRVDFGKNWPRSSN